MSSGFSLADAEAHAARHGYKLTSSGLYQPLVPIDTQEPTEPKLRKRREPNKTEAEYGRILEALKTRGEIRDYKYEGLTLHWGGGMRYTPDWVTRGYHGQITLIEIKGPHVWSRDLVRFKGCRAEWEPFGFHFQMQQKTKGEWRRIH